MTFTFGLFVGAILGWVAFEIYDIIDEALNS
jgi:hypothetical protein